jgi:hypothetical protein
MKYSRIALRQLRRLNVVWLFFAVATAAAQQVPETWQPQIPKAWVDSEIAGLEVPLARPEGSAKHVSAEFYYRIPVRTIYRSYPVYAPGREPAGYLDKLRKTKPEVAFDASLLKTREDWIRAGRIAFEAPTQIGPAPEDPAELEQMRKQMDAQPQTRDGIIPGVQYVIRTEGRIELGSFSCAMCHTRLMPGGGVILGAQGNLPFDPPFGESLLGAPDAIAQQAQMSLFGMPWDPERGPQARTSKMTAKEIGALHMAIPNGVIARHGTSAFHPVQVPDLIGVQDRKYLDRTGLQRHRSIADLMRYGALNQGADSLASHAGFIPGARDFKTRPAPESLRRYSDEQLYALSLYIYSLEPPPNPNQPDELSRQGQRVFQREGCGGCHTPPLYTNNMLTPAPGFKVPAGHQEKYDVLPVSVGTDPNLALHSRRGTGYYKVPSLKGVWYRGPFEHNGSVAALEDWFDPARLKDDYVPTGFKGAGVQTRAVKGHEFGLKLSPDEKRALIAFLKTL